MDISKLPKKIQIYINDLERQREVAINALNKYLSEQSPSPFYIDEHECTGEELGPSKRRRYIQTHRITVEHEGILLDVYVRDKDIDLQWGVTDYSTGEIAFIPQSFQRAVLVSKKNMR